MSGLDERSGRGCTGVFDGGKMFRGGNFGVWAGEGGEVGAGQGWSGGLNVSKTVSVNRILGD